MSTQPLLPGPEPERRESRGTWLDTLHNYQAVAWLGVPVVLGVLLGLLLPSRSVLPYPLDRVSMVIGWTYFSAWSISFYPQSKMDGCLNGCHGVEVIWRAGFACEKLRGTWYALFWASRRVTGSLRRGDREGHRRIPVSARTVAISVPVAGLHTSCLIPHLLQSG